MAEGSIDTKKQLKEDMKTKLIFILLAIFAGGERQPLAAHDGRRFDITVIDNQLYAQGYLSNPLTGENDGGGVVRPYFNAIHGHFSNSNSGSNAFASLPGFDIRISNAAELQGHDLLLTLIGSGRWDSPPAQDGTGLAQDFGVPNLTGLAAGETMFVSNAIELVDTSTLGSITLAQNITGDVLDIDLDYEIDFQPVNSIHFLEWELSTSNAAVSDSVSVYTLLSPDGVGPIERLHFQSLALERHFGVQATAIPEPSSTLCLAWGASCLLLVRKRQSLV